MRQPGRFALAELAATLPRGHQGGHLDHGNRPSRLPAQKEVNGDGAAEVARALDAYPHHLVSVEQASELEEALLGVGHLPCRDEPAGVVDDRDREGVFVGVYAGEHCCHLSSM
jgi:hypothetical protein